MPAHSIVDFITQHCITLEIYVVRMTSYTRSPQGLWFTRTRPRSGLPRVTRGLSGARTRGAARYRGWGPQWRGPQGCVPGFPPARYGRRQRPAPRHSRPVLLHGQPPLLHGRPTLLHSQLTLLCSQLTLLRRRRVSRPRRSVSRPRGSISRKQPTCMPPGSYILCHLPRTACSTSEKCKA